MYIKFEINEGYQIVENARFQWEIDRVKNGIEDLLNKHEALLLDWTKWDDAYEYVQMPNEDFLQDVVESNHFIDQQMNYYAFYNEENEVLQAEGWDFIEDEPKEVPEALILSLPKYRNQSGILHIDGKPIIFITHEVTDNKSEQPPKGLFAFAYDLNDITTERLGHLLQESVRINNVYINATENRKKIHLDPEYIKSYAHLYYPYVNSDAYIQFEIELSHDISQVGFKSNEEIILVFSISFVILFAGMLYIVSRVVYRIGLLNDELIKIYDDKHLNERIELKSKDEIGDIRDHINALLDELQDTQQQLRNHATFDILTGVFNRRVGIEILESEIAAAEKIMNHLQ